MKRLLASLFILLFLPQPSLAAGVKRIAVNPENPPPLQKLHNAFEKVDCSFQLPSKMSYSGQVVSVRKKGVVAKDELFQTEVYVKNNSNVPWFSAASGCPKNVVRLGADKERDRKSPFYPEHQGAISGWVAPNRIEMETQRVDPGKIGIFRFSSQAPHEDGFFREIYTPVVEGVTWINDASITTDMTVGKPAYDLSKKDILLAIQKSANLATLDLNAEKVIDVDISEQKMRVKLGDTIIATFPVSTGTRKTPTPIGSFAIFQKQRVRVASSRPHYIMPFWMQFKGGGYGIHSLPSLANDRGVYWREALNHIGSPRSHGCIRLLPKDAEFMYGFADIGTKVNVHW